MANITPTAYSSKMATFCPNPETEANHVSLAPGHSSVLRPSRKHAGERLDPEPVSMGINDRNHLRDWPPSSTPKNPMPPSTSRSGSRSTLTEALRVRSSARPVDAVRWSLALAFVAHGSTTLRTRPVAPPAVSSDRAGEVWRISSIRITRRLHRRISTNVPAPLSIRMRMRCSLTGSCRVRWLQHSLS